MTERLVRTNEDLQSALASGHTTVKISDGASIRCAAQEVTLAVEGPVRADLEFIDEGAAKVICCGRARVVLTALDHSHPSLWLSGRADVIAKCHGVSRPDFHIEEYARLMLDAFEVSAPTVGVCDFGSYTLFVHDQARPRCREWTTDWEARRSDIYIGQDVRCYKTEQQAVDAAEQLLSAFFVTGSRYAACMRVRGAVPRLCRNVVDIRWSGGTVHVELEDEDGMAWYSADAHHLQPLTEIERSRCTRHYFDRSTQCAAPREA